MSLLDHRPSNLPFNLMDKCSFTWQKSPQWICHHFLWTWSDWVWGAFYLYAIYFMAMFKLGWLQVSFGVFPEKIHNICAADKHKLTLAHFNNNSATHKEPAGRKQSKITVFKWHRTHKNICASNRSMLGKVRPQISGWSADEIHLGIEYY